MHKSAAGYLLLLPFFLVTAMVLAACVYVLIQSLGYVPAFGLEKLTLSYYREILAMPEFTRALAVSLRTALVSAALAAAMGTVLCAALVQGGHRDGGLLYLIRMPILVPHTVVALFTVLIFSQTGLLARCAYSLGLISDSGEFPQLLYTENYLGVIIAYLWKEIPFVAYFTLALMASVSDTITQAAENLGASPLRSFFAVTLPLSMPAVSKAFLIIFLFAFGGFELPLLLGTTLPKALPIHAHMAWQSPDLKSRPYAMAMFSILLLLSLAMACLYSLLMGKLLRKLEAAP